MNLFCVGLSHHTANVETRERFVGHAETEQALRDCGCAEAILITTCNRVEIYAASEKRISTLDLARCLARKIDSSISEEAPFYRYEDAQCVRHLFRVASGLDSMVVGETEVLGQTKKAYEIARTCGAVGPYLHRLFQRAFRAAKQVRTHTDITRGAVSVGSVAIDLAGKIFGDLKHCSVLVLGAGENSERTVRALVSRGVRDVRVSNRSPERAGQLVANVGGVAVPFEQWLDGCRYIDILVTSTAAERPLVTRDNFEPIVRARIDRPLFIIDIAVPRNVDPNVNELDGVYLYDIDALQSVADQALQLRRQQVAVAEEIIAKHVAEFQELLAGGRHARAGSTEHPPIGDGSLRASEL